MGSIIENLFNAQTYQINFVSKEIIPLALKMVLKETTLHLNSFR